jgi:cytochrome b561
MEQNNTEKYSLALRIIHWLMAIIIIGLLTSVYTKKYWPKEFKTEFFFWHKSFGILVLILVAIRLLIKLSTKNPSLPTSFSKATVLMAVAGTSLLYFFMFGSPFSGILMLDASDRQVSFFGLFDLPDFISKNKFISKYSYKFHKTAGLIFAYLIGVHIFAVVIHFIKDKENLLKKMW